MCRQRRQTFRIQLKVDRYYYRYYLHTTIIILITLKLPFGRLNLAGYGLYMVSLYISQVTTVTSVYVARDENQFWILCCDPIRVKKQQQQHSTSKQRNG